MYVHVWVWQKTNWSRSLQTLLQAHRVSSASSRCIMMTSSLLLYSSPHRCTSSNTNIQTCMSKPCRTTWLLMLKQLFTGWFKLTDCVFYKRLTGIQCFYYFMDFKILNYFRINHLSNKLLHLNILYGTLDHLNSILLPHYGIYDHQWEVGYFRVIIIVILNACDQVIIPLIMVG